MSSNAPRNPRLVAVGTDASDEDPSQGPSRKRQRANDRSSQQPPRHGPPPHPRAPRGADGQNLLQQLLGIETVITTSLNTNWRSSHNVNDLNEVALHNLQRLGKNPTDLTSVVEAFRQESDIVLDLHGQLLQYTKNVRRTNQIENRIKDAEDKLKVLLSRIEGCRDFYLGHIHYANANADILLTSEFYERVENSKNYKPLHAVHIHVLKQAHEMRLRKQDDRLFREHFITLANGKTIGTGTWVSYRKIVDFIYFVCRKEVFPEMWVTLKSSNVEVIAAHIRYGFDSELKPVEFNQMLFAFPQGLYYAETNTFLPRDAETGVVDTSVIALDTTKVPCNFFDCDFDPRYTDEEFDVRDIPVPPFEKILDHQELWRPFKIIFAEDRALLGAKGVSLEEAEELVHVEGVDSIDVDRHLNPADGRVDRVAIAESKLTDGQKRDALGLLDGEPTRPFSRREKALVRAEKESVCNSLYTLIGRLLFPLKSKDDMQVAPMIKGISRTGKSTAGMFVFQIYPEHLTRNMPATIEKTFGLDGYQNVYLYGCLEMKKTFGLDQTLLQSMISGERLTINRKNRIAEDIFKWTANGFFVGNDWGPWVDTSGCISERFLNFFFNTVVPESERDGTVSDQLVKYMGNFLVKCVRMYLALVNDESSRKLPALSRFPEYFRWSQLEMQKALNPVFGVIHGGRYEVQKDRYIAFDDFRKDLTSEGMKMSAPEIKTALVQQPSNTIYLAKAPMIYGGSVVDQFYVIGFGYADANRRLDGGCALPPAPPRDPFGPANGGLNNNAPQSRHASTGGASANKRQNSSSHNSANHRRPPNPRQDQFEIIDDDDNDDAYC